MTINENQFKDLLLQGLETETGGVQLYTTALKCVLNPDLKEEWEKYLKQTRKHEQVMRRLIQALGLDPDAETAGRQVCRHNGHALVAAIELARDAGAPAEAVQIVAAECITLAETKDHTNWALLEKVIPVLDRDRAALVEAAVQQVEDEEDEHLYHTKGWTRELWLDSLGLPALLPPPEEMRDVKTAMGAAHAEAKRDVMLDARADARS